ncbi:precorrin-3B synthase [Actinobacteria bacterium YIM 96077]|uniref:Precorrin-3B synthase n=1 Tax=Phytoactinopolyspora halophila TaxID=1981511 RepID=A0A329QPC4_9ACTN|nr:precorrin-3B synthase [Phytoactinopolyspora halophila]AYY15044.1 precorrin-3B synthase [Actinobacteria bacterium YIM 96077]RAW14190.1 precorrin-3B synthase [Phytoactinopolyspora halophila]
MGRSVRERTDACPGALTTHHAADGPLARIRVPGGAISAPQLAALAGGADECASGKLHLTSRANVQIRAVRDVDDLAARLSGAGLLPAPPHERVRNILASPMSGIRGGLTDVRHLVTELDAAICNEPRLTELPGRFQFGLDDGRGDLPPGSLDVGWRAVDDTSGALVVGGAASGLHAERNVAVPAMISAALAFLDLRAEDGSGAWRVRELDPTSLHRLPPMIMNTYRPMGSISVHDHRRGGGAESVGVYRHSTGDAVAIVAGVAFGTLTSAQLRLLAQLAPERAVVTPWRSVIVPGLDPDAAADVTARLDEAGFLLNPGDSALRVSACIGSPGCASSAADVRTDARAVLAELPAGPPIHISGCERRCGRPQAEHVDVVATSEGYVVNGGAPTGLSSIVPGRD